MNTMKVLADEYQGNVRFGYVDIMRDETLKETFEIASVPQNFLFINGTVYEMEALQFGYVPLRAFIES